MLLFYQFCFDRAIRIEPQNPVAYYNKGKLFSFRQKDNEAILLFNQAIQLNPHYTRYANYNLNKTIDSLIKFIILVLIIQKVIYL